MKITYIDNPNGPRLGYSSAKLIEQDALLTVISGGAEPSGLLPDQLPRDMETVEAHCEDKPLDLEPYVDSQGNAYDFAFGLNWSGVICDDRTRRYPKDL